jgi:diguanylate cyclase (GGDEF)-like protein/PAS domain S-box-containing protein
LRVLGMNGTAVQNMSVQFDESDEYWRAVVESAGLGVWDYNTVTGEKRYSQRWRQIRKLGPKDPLPATDEEWLATVHPDDVATAWRHTEMINSGQADEVSFEYRERSGTGQWIWIMCRGRALAHDASGRATRFVGVDTDISDMKATEEAKALYSKQVEIAVTLSGIGIWQFNLVTQAVTWNPRRYAIFGMAQGGPLPSGIWESHIHPDDLQRVLRETALSQVQREDYNMDYRIVRADGEVRHLRSRTSYVPDGLDGPSIIGVEWDMTDDLQQAFLLEQAIDVADQRLAQLSQAQEELEHLSRHDPLTGLPNRRSLDEYVKRLAPKGGAIKGCTFMLIDVDEFKRVNDTRGHAFGDKVLQVLAVTLERQFAPYGMLVRTGGDEFLAVLEAEFTGEAMLNLADGAIEATRADSLAFGHEVTLSIGIDVQPGTADDLFANADKAMYRAKLMGGARAVLA